MNHYYLIKEGGFLVKLEGLLKSDPTCIRAIGGYHYVIKRCFFHFNNKKVFYFNGSSIIKISRFISVELVNIGLKE